MPGLEDLRVLEVMEGADNSAAKFLLAMLPEEAMEKIEAVCMGMSGPYRAASESQLPNMPTGYNRFHISACPNEAVGKVHRKGSAAFEAEGDLR